ncbi:PDZ domain-containing protein [candidate division WOR-3 bacterium]|uniref:PDZ domain-containing protein n=1 Tax=candidate division WOR-3 bacterium TaxID=2052148 RepID=A0A9D5K9M7_UNCW3|nr:PDZ domain-containing protein [candidate division WOR-3 bacterium]MBD3364883.1 PDZ domain-containing protein [candidate division WOR-3 bacterium]
MFNSFLKVCFMFLPALSILTAANSAEVFAEAEKYSVRVYVTTTVALESSQRGSGQGSGFIVQIDKNDGYAYVATCEHVIGDGICNAQISFKDGERIEAEPIYIDPVYDFGMIRFRLDEPGVPSDIKVAKLGNSDNLKIGDRVGTFGHPSGIEFSGTEGIVSSTTNSPPQGTGKFIQTDAPINPGNSGGPLILMKKGAIIGINAATSGQGIGWSLAINQVKPLIDKVISGDLPYTGHVGWMGFDINEITPARATESFLTNFPEDVRKAILITTVAPGNVADTAGVKPGDVVYAINGTIPVDEADYMVMMKDLADKVCTLTVSRFGEKKNFDLKAADRAADRPKEYISVAGMVVQPMSRSLQYWYDMDSSAVYVADVEEESAAASWGAYPGPVRAVAVGGTYYRITSFDGFWQAVKDLKPGDPIEMFYGMERIRSIVKVVYYDELEVPERHDVTVP